MNQFLKTSLILLLGILVLSCQSGLPTSGQEHGLVVKKWRELAKYVNRSTSNNPFTIVGRLSVVKDSNIQKFILTDIHLTQNETKFELNLIQPSFEDKYICTPVCLKLTELLNGNKSYQTMLSRYFAQHEFELFKFYGELVTLDDSLNELLSFSPRAVKQYFSWLMHKEQKFKDLASQIEFLKMALTKDNVISFLNSPDDFYMHLLAKSQNMLDKLNVWNVNDGNVEMENWLSESTPDEVLLTSERSTSGLIAQNWLQIKDEPLAIGDQVCSFDQNELGIVNEIIGNMVQVRVVGKLIQIVDGKQAEPRPGDIYNKTLQHAFVPLDKVDFYEVSTIAHCDID